LGATTHSPLSKNIDSGRISIALLVLPGFDLHDLSCLTEALRLGNDVSGTATFSWHLVSTTFDPVSSSAGIVVMPEKLLSDLDTSQNVILLAGAEPSDSETPQLFQWLRDRAMGRLGFCAIGGGSRVLAAARVLDDKTAAAHWEVCDSLRRSYPDTHFVDRLFITDGTILTCSGRCGTLDFSLHCVAKLCGTDVAKRVADRLNCDQVRGQDRRQNRYAQAGRSHLPDPIRKAIELMSRNIEKPLSTREISRHIGICDRQIQRAFLREFGMTPSRFCQNFRLQCARRMLRQTYLTISEIAAGTGFKTTSHFSEKYSKLFGSRPSKDRMPMGRTDLRMRSVHRPTSVASA
jgi:transcriptional regulator GlxA family with amidase domain